MGRKIKEYSRMKKYVLVFLFLLLTLSSFAQVVVRGSTVGGKSGILGVVYDKEADEPIEHATIRLLKLSDSTYVTGASSRSSGNFYLTVKPGEYIIDVSFMGYKTFTQNIELTIAQPSFNLKKILLEENAVQLGEAVVEAKVPDVLVKGDTIEYNASAFTDDESSMLQDLLKNIAGVEVDKDGNITANGKPIKKILVDGKEFFGNDIAMALSNLPANMIKKLQLFKEDSEMAKASGFKDKERDQVLNLVVKDELKRSAFGDVKAGYGTDNTYNNRGMLNYMNGDNQLSLVGSMGNVNDNARSEGVYTNKSLGFTLNKQATKKFKIGVNAGYSTSKNTLETEKNTIEYSQSKEILSNEMSSKVSNRNNVNSGFNLSWEPDSMTMIYARSNISHSVGDSKTFSERIGYPANGKKTEGKKGSSESNEYNINSAVTIGRKLNAKGRNLSLSISHSIRNTSGDGKNYEKTINERVRPENDLEIIVDQRLNNSNKGHNINLSLAYVEPLGKDYLLQLMYNISNNDTKQQNNAYTQDAAGNYNIIDKIYTRGNESKHLNQSLSLNIQANKEKYSYTAGVSIDPSYSNTETMRPDTLLKDTQRAINFSPTLHFSYHSNPSSTFDFDYAGSSTQPSSQQISTDRRVINSTLAYVGNPDLKASYDNRINMSYQKSDFETGRFFMLSSNIRYSFNNIANYTQIDENGNRAITYRNVDGNMSAGLTAMYNTPLRNKKFSISTNINTSYSQYIGYVNDLKSITNSISLYQSSEIKFKNKKVESRLQVGVNHSVTKNNLDQTPSKQTTTLRLNNFTSVKLPHDFSIQNNIQYSFFGGYGNHFKRNEILWGASISKLFLKNKRGTLRLEGFDILNDRNAISRVVNSEGISDTRTNAISRYCMLSFTYRFNIAKGGGKKSRSDREQVDIDY